ncbi:MAG: helix-turn-helix transcriptional regulator [Armatimonadetes bacterium]|nr:helix-turn-helix transcriptional regulator [Armatimonadota bacterium]
MRAQDHPVYMIGVAAQLCGVHPQTLRQYERLGLVVPSRVAAKNRLYSEGDIERVRRIQRLTQGMGVNLAGVEIIIKLLDQIEDQRADFEKQVQDYVRETERFLQEMVGKSNTPLKKDGTILPVPQIRIRKIEL